jgi:UDP-glucose 4-epimerase
LARAQPGELGDRVALERALEGCDVVVHLAALVDPASDRDEEAQRRITCDATLELAELARKVGVRRFLFMSSIAAMGFFSGRATSGNACRPVSAYGRAKLAAERGLASMSRDRFDVVVLRPPTIYGPGERHNFLTWARAVEQGRFRLIGSGRNVFPLATTQNVARAVSAAVDGRLSRGTFLVADAEPYALVRIHRALLSALGRREPRLRLPRNLALAAGAANELLSGLVHVIPPVLTRARVRTLTADQPFDVSPLVSAGVELDAPLEHWVALTIADYRLRGLLG